MFPSCICHHLFDTLKVLFRPFFLVWKVFESSSPVFNRSISQDPHSHLVSRCSVDVDWLSCEQWAQFMPAAVHLILTPDNFSFVPEWFFRCCCHSDRGQEKVKILQIETNGGSASKMFVNLTYPGYFYHVWYFYYIKYWSRWKECILQIRIISEIRSIWHVVFLTSASYSCKTRKNVCSLQHQ